MTEVTHQFGGERRDYSVNEVGEKNKVIYIERKKIIFLTHPIHKNQL